MAVNISRNANPIKRKFSAVLEKARMLEPPNISSEMSLERQEELYVLNERIIEGKIRQIGQHIASLKELNEKWLGFLFSEP